MPQAGTRVFERLPAFTIEPRTAKAFAFAAICAGIALVSRLAVGAIEPAAPPLSAFLFATMVTAIVAGSTAGLVCALLGLAFAATMFSTHVPHAFSLVALLQYVLISTFIIWIADEYRRLLRRAQDRHREAEQRMRLISAENQTLTMMAADKPLTETLPASREPSSNIPAAKSWPRSCCWMPMANISGTAPRPVCRTATTAPSTGWRSARTQDAVARQPSTESLSRRRMSRPIHDGQTFEISPANMA